MTDLRDLPSMKSLAAMRDRAEDVATRAKTMADTLRVAYARELLREAFPGYTLAVFARDWNEDQPLLLQILSDQPDQVDIDLSLSSPAFLPDDQRLAAYEAQLQIAKIGSDEEILEHLDPGEIEHEGWEEFMLSLAAEHAGAVR